MKRSFVVAVLSVLVCMVLSLATAPKVCADGTVGMLVEPTPKAVELSQSFTVDVMVTVSGGGQVDSAEAHIDFDTDYLEVLSVSTGATFAMVLTNTFDNEAGTIDYAAGAVFGSPPASSSFVLATVEFSAKSLVGVTPVTFVFDSPFRETTAFLGGVEVIDREAVVDGSVEITVAAPAVATAAASGVEEASATLNGSVSADGGEACQYRFEYGTSTGVYDHSTEWAGAVTTGQPFNEAVSGLERGTKYYFRAQAKNSGATSNGLEMSFLTKPDAPSGLAATAAGPTQADLSWSKGVGAQRTKIQRKEGDYPAHRNDGVQVYFGSGTSVCDGGLSPDTVYYYRAWSEVSGSQQWSDGYAEASATTESAEAPTVNTSEATVVEEASATLNGTVGADGGEACQYRFEYDTDSGEPYAYSTGWTESVASGEAFDEAVSGLERGTKYYFRAQGKNSGGTSSGLELSFLTKPDAPAGFAATTTGSTQIRLFWTKGEGAQKTAIQRKEGTYPVDRDDGTRVYFDTGVETVDAALSSGSTYYYRAWSYVEGSEQWSDAFAEASASTAEIVAPAVVSENASSVAESWAVLDGTLSSDGNEACEYRFEYGTDEEGPYPYHSGWTGDKTTGEPFGEAVYGLAKGNRYYFRALARNSAGSSAGSVLSLLTKPDGPYAFEADAVGSTEIDLSWVRGEGAQRTKIQRKEGGYPVDVADGVEVYFDAGMSVSDTGLAPGTTYYYRAWSEVSGGGQWSDGCGEASATTAVSGGTPTVSTGAATLVEETTATLNGTVEDDTGAPCEYRFQYGTSPGVYDNETVWTGSARSGEAFGQSVAGLSKGTKYYFRAQARNGGGTGSGVELSFLSKPDAPVGFEAAVLGSSRIELSWTKGDGAQKTRVLRKEGGYPVDRSDGVELYFDIGAAVSDTGLASGTAYYYRAWSYVQGSEQWSDACGEAMAVTNTVDVPSATTDEASAVGESGATLNGTLDDDGGEPCEYRFEYGTTEGGPYLYNTGWTGAVASGESFSDLVYGLEKGATYYYRAQVRSGGGTAYGCEQDFATVALYPDWDVNRDGSVNVLDMILIGQHWTG